MNFSKVVHRGQGVGVVVAQCLLAAGQGLLEQLASALEVPEAAVGLGEVIMEVGVVVAQHSPVADQGLLVQPAGALWIPRPRRVTARLLIEANVSGCSGPALVDGRPEPDGAGRRRRQHRPGLGGSRRGCSWKPGCRGGRRPVPVGGQPRPVLPASGLADIGLCSTNRTLPRRVATGTPRTPHRVACHGQRP
jgi:hypothetical protein